MLKAAGYPKGVSFSLIIPSGDATYARAAALLQQELAASGFTANIQQIPGADFLTDVYIKKQGDAVLSEELSNGPDLTNSFEALFEPSGFPANAFGSVNQQLTPLIVQANASLSPSLQGPLMQQIDKTVIQARTVGPAGLHAVDRRLQQEPGRWERRRPDRAVPLRPGRHLHQEVAAGRGPHEDDRGLDDVPPQRISLS